MSADILSHSDVQGVLERSIDGNPELELSISSLTPFGRADISFESRGERYVIEVKGGKFSQDEYKKGVGQALLYGLHGIEKAFLALPRKWLSHEHVSNLIVFIRRGNIPFNLILVSNPGIEIVGDVESHINF